MKSKKIAEVKRLKIRVGGGWHVTRHFEVNFRETLFDSFT